YRVSCYIVETHSLLFSFDVSFYPLYLHSFPTRRSSDLLLPLDDCLQCVDGVRVGIDGSYIEAELAQIQRVAPVGTPHFKRFTRLDRKSTRLNSSHVSISYAVFCLKKKIKIFR